MYFPESDVSKSDAEVRPVANLIRLRKARLSGLGGFPHERLHQDKCVNFDSMTR
ncbi:hypothetical protein [Moorena producens]|uniref:hypothetical protein n=1 Tax=Moorena producens TaxID=1155739 RepID=UPI001314D843|nr:hypothetical protein [Moorena producens]